EVGGLERLAHLHHVVRYALEFDHRVPPAGRILARLAGKNRAPPGAARLRRVRELRHATMPWTPAARGSRVLPALTAIARAAETRDAGGARGSRGTPRARSTIRCCRAPAAARTRARRTLRTTPSRCSAWSGCGSRRGRCRRRCTPTPIPAA